MASFTITIPDDRITDAVDAFANRYNYQETIDDLPNPISKPQFAKGIINSFIKEVYVAYKLEEVESTRQQIITDSTIEVADFTVE